MRTIKIATRASKLALTQSEYIGRLLRQAGEDVEISTVHISTKGDRDRSDFLYKSSSVGFFTSEIENALLDRRGHVAVHSLKDLPTAITEGLAVAAIPQREAVCDVLVASKPLSGIDDLPAGATIGTSSVRRIAQVMHLRSDLKCVPMRGNVETRVRKVAEGQVDAIVIAQAGLKRLGMADNISCVLDPNVFIPAPAQGALAVQIRADDSELMELVSKLDDKNSRITAETERHILAAMHGGCSIPLGVHTTIDEGSITIDAMICDEEGKRFVRRSATIPVTEAKTAALKMAEELLTAGGKEILEDIRKDRTNQE